MALTYRKNKNTTLFRDLERIGVQQAQNYVPLYTRFFSLNSTNWSNVTLNNVDELISINDGDGFRYTCTVRDFTTEGDRKVPVFFKMCPLVDPAKYLTGVYANQDISLPSLDGECHPKIADKNNSAYVDSFFYYLTSRLRGAGFIHGLDFYGSYLGLKRDFRYNLEDDASFCMNNSYFEKNNNILLSVNTETPKREKIAFGDDIEVEVDDLTIEQESTNAVDAGIDEVSIHAPTDSLKLRSHSLCSSNSSNTVDSEPETSDIGSHGSSGDDLAATITSFPVQVVAMEACVDTLDSILRQLSAEELTAALMQVILTLAAYNRIFQFTHNDLHTNNIMYVVTDVPFLYYLYNGTSYRVPTFGKIYKLIDFGRSIYTFSDRRFVSDSFSTDGDAATQYNIEPYFNSLKSVIDANYSFDLCRLACSMLDVLPETPEFEPLCELIDEWCMDDKGRNVVYKQNGDERYPCFKLYKMIARTVHSHTADAQLKRSIFQKYVVKKKSIKNNIIMNLDTLEA